MLLDISPECRTLIILDIEYTAWEGSQARGWSEPWEERETVQMAMLALDAKTLAPQNHFSCLIKPTINPILSDYFMKLTGITQENLDRHGLSLAQAFEQSQDFINSFDQPVQVICNGLDSVFLANNGELVGVTCPDCLKGGQNIFAFLQENIPTYRAGHCSGDLARLVGHPIEGHMHNALFDVHSIAVALRYIKEKQAA
ncbi:putative Inhibitor of the KinA pathway to sporulation [Candidatus Terasakiella magnetica]|uniref:Putative Inhibitor of the KinA pathway to sporulation n=1 Tax=Candidatus Terasakiella magnetica TaxID=1867952 RepID=A0A1C3RGD2_9PROT|nr:exonuclease domain-containing protein [Candidatus Terasakiella magnetica]SCA56308.1 putative Inhibitor of the KinA pathway to sporulation [Candidatus Terasakiella magnetica]